jgi:hypothetical protein
VCSRCGASPTATTSQLLPTGTATNVTHAVLGGLGLLAAAIPRGTQRPGGGPPTFTGAEPVPRDRVADLGEHRRRTMNHR